MKRQTLPGRQFKIKDPYVLVLELRSKGASIPQLEEVENQTNRLDFEGGSKSTVHTM
jgi:hypothetical protein